MKLYVDIRNISSFVPISDIYQALCQYQKYINFSANIRNMREGLSFILNAFHLKQFDTAHPQLGFFFCQIVSKVLSPISHNQVFDFVSLVPNCSCSF